MTARPFLRPVVALAAALALSGCGNSVYFFDDVDLTIDLALFNPFAGSSRFSNNAVVRSPFVSMAT